VNWNKSLKIKKNIWMILEKWDRKKLNKKKAKVIENNYKKNMVKIGLNKKKRRNKNYNKN
jgi:hypothetical protein